MRRKFNLSKLILIILIPIIIFSISFLTVAFDKDYYVRQFEKNKVYEQFDMNKTELHQINYELLDYLQHGKGEINNTFFNSKEKTHLVEVKDLIKGSLVLFYFFLTIFILLLLILYFKNKKNFTKHLLQVLIIGNILNIILTLILSALSLLNFSKFFTKFHLALFKSDTWMLNPATDNLIKMFPKQFFYNTAVKIISQSLIISIILAIAFFYVYKVYKKKQSTE